MLDAADHNLRALVNTYARLSRDRTRSANRAHQFSYAIDPALDHPSVWKDRVTPPGKLHGNAVRALTIQLQKRAPATINNPNLWNVLDLELHALNRLEELLEEYRAAIESALIQPPLAETFHRLMTIPAAATLRIAPLMVAAHCRLDQMQRDQVTACLGAMPRLKQSGEKVGGHPPKIYSPAASALHLWTLKLIQDGNNPVARHYAGGEKKGGRKLTAAKNKLARIIQAVACDPAGYREGETQ